MKKGFLVLLILAACHVSSGFAGDNSLWLDGISLSLGMQKDVAVDLLSKGHRLKKVGERDNYIVQRKGEPEGNDIVGQVQFVNGKLSWASQTWGRFTSKDSLDLSNNLYAAIDGLLKNGEKIIIVRTETRRSPEMTLSTIEFIFPNKTIEVSISDGRNVVKNVIIQENLARY